MNERMLYDLERNRYRYRFKVLIHGAICVFESSVHCRDMD